MNNKKNKLKLFDFFLILLTLTILAGGIWLSIQPDYNEQEGEQIKIKYDIVFETVDKSISGNIVSDKTIYGTNGRELGKIKGVISRSKTIYTLDRTTEGNEANYIDRASAEFDTVRITIESEAVIINGIIHIKSQRILAGEKITICFKDFYGEGRISNLEKIN